MPFWLERRISPLSQTSHSVSLPNGGVGVVVVSLHLIAVANSVTNRAS